MVKNSLDPQAMPRKAPLDALLYPKKIALIGATNSPGKAGCIILDLLKSYGAELFPVHPKEKVIRGIPAAASPGELPEGIDLAIISTGAETAAAAAEQCAARGVKYIIIVAGGFGETGEEGKALEAGLKALPARYGTRILGPNSLGLFVPETGLDTIFVEHGDRALAGGGGIAFITQSGSVGVESLGYASNIGFGMRAFVGLGNKCDLNESDFLSYFARDDRTECLAFYIENIEEGRLFLEKAGETARTKPVLVLKAGRSEAGGAAVSSHTGRLAGSDKVVSGAFRQYGIQRAMDDEELSDGARVLSLLKPPRGNRVGIITAAGGYGVMCTDYVEENSRRAPLRMARFAPETVARLKQVNLPFAGCNNPVDITASAGDEMYLGTLDALLDSPGVDIVICISLFAPPTITDGLIENIAKRVKTSEKPIIVFTQYGPFTDAYLKRFFDAGVPGYPSVYRAVRAARFLVERREILEAGEEKR
jgi:acyl-CoA synthetase (NDP forming)